jgi:hypothetical protein
VPERILKSYRFRQGLRNLLTTYFPSVDLLRGYWLIVASLLHHPKPGISTTHRDQLIMTAALNHSTIIHDQDLISINYGRQAMGNDQGRSPSGRIIKRRLHRLLIARI